MANGESWDLTGLHDLDKVCGRIVLPTVQAEILALFVWLESKGSINKEGDCSFMMLESQVHWGGAGAGDNYKNWERDGEHTEEVIPGKVSAMFLMAGKHLPEMEISARPYPTRNLIIKQALKTTLSTEETGASILLSSVENVIDTPVFVAEGHVMRELTGFREGKVLVNNLCRFLNIDNEVKDMVEENDGNVKVLGHVLNYLQKILQGSESKAGGFGALLDVLEARYTVRINGLKEDFSKNYKKKLKLSIKLDKFFDDDVRMRDHPATEVTSLFHGRKCAAALVFLTLVCFCCCCQLAVTSKGHY